MGDATPRKSKYVRKTDRKFEIVTVKAPCLHCEKTFLFSHASGRLKQYCSDACRKERAKMRFRGGEKCVVEGCGNPRAYTDGICNSCYYRRKRTGTTKRRQWTYRSTGTNGYVRLSQADHPLATADGFVYEHRKVLFGRIGPGEHSCHWCKKPVAWAVGTARRGNLVADHLDGNRLNNASENLVPACNPCNSARGLFQSWVMRHSDDPWLWRMFQKASAEGVFSRGLV